MQNFAAKSFEKAEVIFTISDGLTEYYASTYKSYEFCTLVHGFNIPKQIFKDFSIDISEKLDLLTPVLLMNHVKMQQ